MSEASALADKTELIASSGQVFSIPISKIAIAPAHAADAGDPPASGTAGTAHGQTGHGGDGNSGNTSSGSSIPVIALGSKYQMTVTPIESDRYYSVAGVSDFWSITTLDVSHMANSDVPSSVTVSFSDLVPKRIESIASLAGMVAKLSVASTGTPNPPRKLPTDCEVTDDVPSFAFVVDPDTLTELQSDDGGVAIPVEGKPNKKTCWLIHLAHPMVAVDAISRDAFQLDADGEKSVAYFPVTTCLRAEIRLDNVQPVTANGVTTRTYNPRLTPNYAAKLRLIDPQRIRAVQLPEDGKIEMQPVCGADVTDKLTDRYGDYFTAASQVLSEIGPQSGSKSPNRPSGSGRTTN